jgi:hypothetical protein
VLPPVLPPVEPAEPPRPPDPPRPALPPEPPVPPPLLPESGVPHAETAKNRQIAILFKFLGMAAL